MKKILFVLGVLTSLQSLNAAADLQTLTSDLDKYNKAIDEAKSLNDLTLINSKLTKDFWKNFWKSVTEFVAARKKAGSVVIKANPNEERTDKNIDLAVTILYEGTAESYKTLLKQILQSKDDVEKNINLAANGKEKQKINAIDTLKQDLTTRKFGRENTHVHDISNKVYSGTSFFHKDEEIIKLAVAIENSVAKLRNKARDFVKNLI